MRETVASESPTTAASARFVRASWSAALSAALVTTADGSGLAASWERGRWERMSCLSMERIGIYTSLGKGLAVRCRLYRSGGDTVLPEPADVSVGGFPSVLDQVIATADATLS